MNYKQLIEQLENDLNFVDMFYLNDENNINNEKSVNADAAQKLVNEVKRAAALLHEFVRDKGLWLYFLEVGPVPITASHAEDFGC